MPRFGAPWDRTLRAVTVAAVVLLALAVAVFALVAARADLPAALSAAVAALAAALVGATWALAPRGFSVEAGQVRVERPLRPVAIAAASIRSAGLLPPDALRGALRLGGSGGLFGYYGRFWSRSLGSFRLYATRRVGLVRIDTVDERFVLSPEPPERFLEEVVTRAPQARAAGDAPPPPRPLGRGLKLGLAAALAIVPLAVAGILGASQAWTPVGSRLTEEAVVIERRWASP
ncbi:MAG TPA: PH domain-containing protein, partial [Anaeromyxobacteraceae bacterium]|nr:PH domain-containing protein [Anaeromyxobacteraceae bacterium]